MSKKNRRFRGGGGGRLFWVWGGVGARNRCHLSNWRFNPETVHFLSSERPFLPTMFVSKCYKTKHFGQDSLFHKKPKLRRRNHHSYSVKMGERAKSL